jgi:predicted nucleic acid-binding protein
MSTIILLDTGPLGMISSPHATPNNEQANTWLELQLAQSKRVLIPEISDYELRRELLRAGKIKGLAKLNGLKRSLGYAPLNTRIMLQAAEYWAQSRRLGRQNADDTALDGDVILAAQAAWLQTKGHQVIIATTNPKHLELFVDARRWSEIA